MNFVLCPKQGNKTEGGVLNRVGILGFFCPKQGQGLSMAHLFPILVGYPGPLGPATQANI